jgi:hypothetical protein
MRPQPQGNGSGEFEIVQKDMGGWVRVFPAKEEDTARGDLAFYLSQTLADWFRQRPHLRMKCIVPMDRDGSTVELHAWYEIHVVPATPVGPQSAGYGQG